MQRYNVDGLNFDFPDNWQVSQYDNWSFYRNQVARMWNGIKALDLLAVDPKKNSVADRGKRLSSTSTHQALRAQ